MNQSEITTVDEALVETTQQLPFELSLPELDMVGGGGSISDLG